MSNKYILMFGVLRVRILSFSWRGSLVSYIVWGRNGVFPRYCPVYIPGIYLNKTGLNEHITVLHFEPDDRRGTQVVKLIRTSQFVWRKYCCVVGFSWYNGLYLQLFPIFVTIKHFFALQKFSLFTRVQRTAPYNITNHFESFVWYCLSQVENSSFFVIGLTKPN